CAAPSVEVARGLKGDRGARGGARVGGEPARGGTAGCPGRAMSIPPAETLEWLFHPRPAEGAINRQTLAVLLVELARAVEPRTEQPQGVAPFDPRLDDLRRLILGGEIDLLERLRQVIDDPERLGLAVGRALPTPGAARDMRPRPGAPPSTRRGARTP